MHAYLIMAHNNFQQLQVLIRLLDDKRNHIYIHIDAKSKNVDLQAIKRAARYSKICFIPRINIRWAGYSGIECEIKLLEAAVPGNYDYYHLLSGNDLPLRSQDYIHEFFNKNYGREFLSYDSAVPSVKLLKRVKEYYFFQDIYGRDRRNPLMLGLYTLDKLSVRIQRLLKVNRAKRYAKKGYCNGLKNGYQKGENWFSITSNLAHYILECKEEIKSMYSFTRSGDEVFLQTLVNNSYFSTMLYNHGVHGSLRYIDWRRGKPYTFCQSDYEELMNSQMLFARKFDINTDEKIIHMIEKTIVN